MARSTWYVLEDGRTVDPNDCAPGEDGVMRHKSGVAVAMRGDTLSSRGVDLDDLPDQDAVPSAKAKKTKAAEAETGKAESEDGVGAAAGSKDREARPEGDAEPAEKPRKRGSYKTRETKTES